MLDQSCIKDGLQGGKGSNLSGLYSTSEEQEPPDTHMYLTSATQLYAECRVLCIPSKLLQFPFHCLMSDWRLPFARNHVVVQSEQVVKFGLENLLQGQHPMERRLKINV